MRRSWVWTRWRIGWVVTGPRCIENSTVAAAVAVIGRVVLTGEQPLTRLGKTRPKSRSGDDAWSSEAMTARCNVFAARTILSTLMKPVAWSTRGLVVTPRLQYCRAPTDVRIRDVHVERAWWGLRFQIRFLKVTETPLRILSASS